ncbi:hypothetical protein [Alteromonas lipotrueae]|uniref:hypothetical protein n=1 Tax=Alteromonas lipotrueae TaxID=2803814 RepID=UPI001C480C95|nr:hypothetical protein [Alteromonas lipotrueae]
MKKLALILIMAFTANVNAAIINVSTDQATYNVGDTILATVMLNVDELPDSAIGFGETLVSGYDLNFTFDDSLLSFISGSESYGTGLGVVAFSFPVLAFAGVANVSQAADIFADLATLQPDFGEFMLFSLQFTATNVGSGILDVVSNSPIAMLTDFFGDEIPSVTTQSASFSVEATSVPAPSTGVLALLACFGMAVSRVKSRR